MIELRTATAADQSGIAALIDAVFREYDDQIWLSGCDSDLTDLEHHYFQPGGHFWVLADQGRIVGSHAALPTETPGVCTFRRLYLAAELRGTGWGERLMQHNLEWARQHGYRRIEFWSDRRFSRAHQFFERLGFQRGDSIRDVLDGWQPFQEYFYSLDL